jgi:chromosome segregation ATPase
MTKTASQVEQLQGQIEHLRAGMAEAKATAEAAEARAAELREEALGAEVAVETGDMPRRKLQKLLEEAEQAEAEAKAARASYGRKQQAESILNGRLDEAYKAEKAEKRARLKEELRPDVERMGKLLAEAKRLNRKILDKGLEAQNNGAVLWADAMGLNRTIKGWAARVRPFGFNIPEDL